MIGSVGLRARVVYKFQSSCDGNMSYIGKTKRHLTIRSAEHLSQRPAIFDHLKECKTCKASASLKSFTVLHTAQNDIELRIKEALYIKKQQPPLNRQLAQQGASYLLSIF